MVPPALGASVGSNTEVSDDVNEIGVVGPSTSSDEEIRTSEDQKIHILDHILHIKSKNIVLIGEQSRCSCGSN